MIASSEEESYGEEPAILESEIKTALNAPQQSVKILERICFTFFFVSELPQ